MLYCTHVRNKGVATKSNVFVFFYNLLLRIGS